MLRYIIRRILFVIPVMLGVLLIVFILTELTPGDIVDQIMLGDIPQEMKDAKREELGLNDPMLLRYGRYIWKLVTEGDMGTSYKTNQPVAGELMARFPATAFLAFSAVFIGVLIGIPLGVWSAVKQYTWVDSLVLVFSMVAAAMPSFWLALLLIMLFSVRLGWLPSAGIVNPLGWVLPIIVVSVSCVSMVVRVTRSSMLEVIRQDYIRTARAKGQKKQLIITRHALRNALIPVLTSIGGQFGMQLGGALIIETIFGVPGIGKYMVDAISYRNFPAIQGGVILLALVYTIINLLVDISYAMVDPRIRMEMSQKRVSRWRLRRMAVKEGIVNG